MVHKNMHLGFRCDGVLVQVDFALIGRAEAWATIWLTKCRLEKHRRFDTAAFSLTDSICCSMYLNISFEPPGI